MHIHTTPDDLWVLYNYFHVRNALGFWDLNAQLSNESVCDACVRALNRKGNIHDRQIWHVQCRFVINLHSLCSNTFFAHLNAADTHKTH